MARQDNVEVVDSRQLEDEQYVLGYLRPDVGGGTSLEARVEALLVSAKARARAKAGVRQDRLRPRERRLHDAGGSLCVTLPSPFVQLLSWKRGDDVRIRLEGASIIIE